MAFTLAAGGVLGIIVYAAAPLLIRILMGKDFGPAVDVLRLLALLPPILSLTHSLGLQWLLPLGRERTVNRIMISAGFLNIMLALILCPRYGHMGMATGVIISETYVCMCMVATMALDPSRGHILARGNPGAAAKTTK
jgi:O-antigen/teichoic acid export membrane protein